MMTSEVKKICGDTIIPMIQNIQKNRALVTDEILDAFMLVRPLNLK